MHLRALTETVVYKGQVSKGEVLPRHRYKETRILLNNTLTFSEVEVKLKYVEAILILLSFLQFAFYFNMDYEFILT